MQMDFEARLLKELNFQMQMDFEACLLKEHHSIDCQKFIIIFFFHD